MDKTKMAEDNVVIPLGGLRRFLCSFSMKKLPAMQGEEAGLA